jgi:hypothetical protein
VQDCELCRRQSCIYDFTNICCRVRFVMALPHREMRAGWIARWRKRDGDQIADAVEQEVRARWSTRK